MVSKRAEADILEMWEHGLKPTVADIIRLNALALRREFCNHPSDDLYHARRCAFLGDGDDRIVMREPCLGHEVWVDEVEQIVDLGNPETYFAIEAYICGVDLSALPPSNDRAAVRSSVDAFIARLSGFTRGQIAAAVMYCTHGPSSLQGEFAARKPNDGDEPPQGDGSFSLAIGIVRHGIALGIGMTLADALSMPRRAMESMIEINGGVDGKKRKARLEDDYLRTLDEITDRLSSKAEPPGEGECR